MQNKEMQKVKYKIEGSRTQHQLKIVVAKKLNQFLKTIKVRNEWIGFACTEFVFKNPQLFNN